MPEPVASVIAYPLSAVSMVGSVAVTFSATEPQFSVATATAAKISSLMVMMRILAKAAASRRKITGATHANRHVARPALRQRKGYKTNLLYRRCDIA
jgi:hypothetical protein